MKKAKQFPNVLLITIDSLRPDYLGCYSQWAKEENLSPHIDSWAEDAVLFENAIAQGPRTPESFPALLSGQYMTRYRDAFTGLSQERKLISQMLKGNDYLTAAFNSNPYISKHSNYDRGFDIFVDELFRTAGGSLIRKLLLKYLHLKGLLGTPYTSADKVNQRVFSLFQNIKQPYFVWVHYMDVHGPYVSKKGWHFKNTVRGGMLWRKATHAPKELKPKEKEELVNTYKEEVHYTDFHIGELLSKVDEHKTLAILTSDHGELLGEHGLFAHVPGVLYDQLLKVPLIVKPPSTCLVRESRISRAVKLLDVVPTILDILNLDHHSAFDGESLVPLIQGDPEAYKCESIISEVWTKLLSVRKNQWKFIAHYVKGKKYLYDLENDPNEKYNLADERQDIVEEMQQKIKHHLLEINAPTEDIEKCGFGGDEAIRSQLKALGYM